MTPQHLGGRYRLVREIGRGGMGVVWEAVDERSSSEVALKLLEPKGLDASELRRFAREARAAARLAHPHVVSVLEAGEHDGHAYLVLELVPGGTLRGVGVLNAREAIAVARQLALALAHAHARGVVHRDLKPENVLVATRSPLTVKLTDFGLAVIQGASRFTHEGAVVGTFTYLAPEQATGGALDGRSDLYALGVMLFELLAGIPPFTGSSAQAVLAQHLRAEPPSLRRHAPDAPAELEALIRRLLAKQPADRPASAEEVVAALDAIAVAETDDGPRARPQLPPVLFRLTELIGRDDEVRRVTELVARERARVVTLTGPGGIGKTRVAMQLAVDLLAHVPAVAFARLEDVRDPALVETEVAAALGARPRGTALGEAVRAACRAQPTLLVLDNFEHVMAATPWLASLMDDVPTLRVIVTSRQPLRIPGEREVALGPLAVADAEERSPERLQEVPAIALFLRRARAARPDLAWTDAQARVVAEICTRLDGLPLAIELAAARTRVLPPIAIRDQLAARDGRPLHLLRDRDHERPDRQRTIHAAIEWTHATLDECHRRWFRRLGAFAGAASLPALERVCGEPGDEGLEIVSTLAEQSLLVRPRATDDEARFTMLQPIRDFARERLEQAGEADAIAQRHLDWFLAHAERLAPRLRGADHTATMTELERDDDNLRTALQWAESHGEGESMGRLALALRWYWATAGNNAEGLRWLRGAMDSAGPLPDTLRARLGVSAAVMSHHLGDFATSEAMYARSIELFRAAGDDSGVAICLGNLGTVALDRGQAARALELFESSLAMRRRRGDTTGIAGLLINLSAVHVTLEQWDKVPAVCAEALQLTRQAGDDWGSAAATDNLGVAALYRGDLDDAELRLRESLSIWRRLGDPHGVSRALLFLGRTALKRDDAKAAEELFVESLGLLRRIGDKVLMCDVLEGLSVARSRVDTVSAARLLGAAETLRESTGSALQPPDRPWVDRVLERLAGATDRAATQAARAEGRAMALDEALALALSGVPAR